MHQVVAVHMDAVIFDSYYNGCCNATLWPLFHSMPDRAQFDSQHWRNYYDANKEFAVCTIKALNSLPKSAPDEPLVWLHDYHLMLAATWIRKVS